ncbi:tetratricopeptide repeat protein, partial [Fulvivirga lutimaris]|uniref:tetratricopeptide repeat protein n=1 Tax=Fulvivirga lutimaris TaxID=1819566 RepID=UPI0012BC977A
TVTGGAYWGFGDYQKSLENYLSALKEYQKLDDVIGRSICLNNIGEVYKKIGDYDNALNYLKHALSLKESVLGVGGSPLANSNLGELYTLMGQYENAENSYMAALNGKIEEGSRIYAYVNNGLGSLYLKTSQFNKSISYFKEAIKVEQSLDDQRGIAYALFNLGSAFQGLNELDSAEYYLRKSLATSITLNADDILIDVYKNLSEVDSLNGDYPKAFYHYKKHTELKDSIFNLEKSAQLARIQTEYETEILQKDNEAKQADVKQKNTMIIAVIMLLILAIALANAFYNQRTVQKNANKALKSKSEQIESQAAVLQKQSVKLQEMNDNLENSNQNLEEKIRQRTEQLREQNKVLSDYAFFHAHELRAPVANILGLIELLKHSELPQKDLDVVAHLYTATSELDKVIRNITTKVSGNGEIKP